MSESRTNSVSVGTNGHPSAGTPDRRIELAPGTLEVLTRSLKYQWKRYRKQLKKCQRKLTERTVHDLRIEARRLLSLLVLLAPFLSGRRLVRAQEILKRHLDTFDDLRDTQVQSAMVGELRKEFSAARSFHRFLKKREARLIRLTRKEARRLTNKTLGKRLNACRADTQAWLAASGSRQANPLLVRSVARAYALTHTLMSHIDPRETHSIHRTRIAFKRFRYMLEALAGILPWASKKLLARLRRYQASMGDIQDAEVLLRAFEKFLRKENAEARPALQFSVELQRRRQKLIATYLSTADDLIGFWPPKRAAGAVRKAVAVDLKDRRKASTRRHSDPALPFPKMKAL